MPLVNDVTKVVSSPFLPIGFWAAKGNKSTVQEIKKWHQEERPNFIKRQPIVTICGAILAVGGVLSGLFGLKKDSNILKWLGGALALIGIVSTAIGKFLGINLEAINSDTIVDKKLEKSDRENFLKELKNITSKYDISLGSPLIHHNCPNESVLIPERYIEGVNSLLEIYGKQTVIGWINEIIDHNEMMGVNPSSHPYNNEQLNNICNALICSTVICEDSVVEKSFQYAKDAKLNEHLREASLRGLVLRERFIKKDSAITSRLVNQLKDEDPFVRIKSATALASIGSKSSIRALGNLLNDEVIDQEVLGEAAEALGYVKDPEAVKTLAKFYFAGSNVKVGKGSSKYPLNIVAIVSLKKNVNYSVKCLIETLGSYYSGKIKERPNAEWSTLIELLPEIKDEETKKLAIESSIGIIDKYLEGKIEERPRDARDILANLLNSEERIKFCMERIFKHYNGEIKEYPYYLVNEFGGLLRIDEIIPFCKAVIEEYRAGRIKNRPEHEIWKDLENLIGKEETAKLLQDLK